MTREEKRKNKYPETHTFHYYNANPKNRFTGDCVVRAICTACEVPYNQVVMDLAKIQCETGYDCGDRGTDILLKQYGWTKMKQPRKENNTKFTGKEFCDYLDGLYIDGKLANKVVMNIGGHHMSCIINYKIWDIWDCGDGCIGNYWVKL